MTDYDFNQLIISFSRENKMNEKRNRYVLKLNIFDAINDAQEKLPFSISDNIRKNIKCETYKHKKNSFFFCCKRR